MFVSYDINVTSHRTPESFKLALTESVSSGNFVTVLEAKSGIEIESTHDLHFDDYSPTSKPTMSPSSVLSSRAGEFTTKVTIVNMILSAYWLSHFFFYVVLTIRIRSNFGDIDILTRLSCKSHAIIKITMWTTSNIIHMYVILKCITVILFLLISRRVRISFNVFLWYITRDIFNYQKFTMKYAAAIML